MPQRIQAPVPPPSKRSLLTLADRPLSDWIPDAFPSTQQIPMLQTRQMRPGLLGQYADPSNYRNDWNNGAYPKVPLADTPFIRIGDPKQQVVNSPKYPPNQTAAHEAGHSIWHQDLSVDQQNAWSTIHRNNIKPVSKGDSPSFIKEYMDDPGHSFAEAYSQYATSPEKLQKEAPDAYQFIRGMTGFEYFRR